MKLAYLALYLSVFLTVFSQLLLKIAADRESNRLLRTVNLLCGYSLLCIALGLNIYGLRSVPLSDLAYILPFTFVLVPLMSMLFLGEKLGARFWVGGGFVVAGALVFNLG